MLNMKREGELGVFVSIGVGVGVGFSVSIDISINTCVRYRVGVIIGISKTK